MLLLLHDNILEWLSSTSDQHITRYKPETLWWGQQLLKCQTWISCQSHVCIQMLLNVECLIRRDYFMAANICRLVPSSLKRTLYDKQVRDHLREVFERLFKCAMWPLIPKTNFRKYPKILWTMKQNHNSTTTNAHLKHCLPNSADTVCIFKFLKTQWFSCTYNVVSHF